MESYQENIIAYLKGTLSPDELQSFEVEMKFNSELANEVLFQQKLLFVLENKDQIEAHDLMKSVIEAHPITNTDISDQSNNDTNTPFDSIWKAGLGILITGLLIFCLYQYLNPPKTKYQLIAAEYNLPMENLMNVGAISDQDLAQGMQNYDQNNFVKAIPLLESYCGSNNDNIASFYLAISYLQVGKYKSAVKILENLNKSDDLILKNKIKHYLAIGYLSLNNYTYAQKILLTIIPSERNQEILDLIKKVQK